jgi:hypothetical protein
VPFISAKYEDAHPFKDGIALVKLNNKYSFITVDSANAFKRVFDKAEEFREGKARVVDGEDTFYIKRSGERIGAPSDASAKIPGPGPQLSKPAEKDEGDQPTGEGDAPTVDMCPVTCETKGIKGVEVSFTDPRTNKKYVQVSAGNDLEFNVPCYLQEEYIQVFFKKNNRTEDRWWKLKRIEIPDTLARINNSNVLVN